jgi:Arc/MetJ-type ribon-helix-helix transcriptional regulator
MPATKRLVLDLPEETVADIEARVAAGGYADASAAVAAAVSDTAAADPWEDTPEFRAWLAEGDEIVARIEAGEEDDFIPAEQVFAELKAELREMIARETKPAPTRS